MKYIYTHIILLIGSGGREHAIAKALFRTKRDNDIIELYCFACNNNPGIRKLAKRVMVGKSKEELDNLLEIIANTYNIDDYTIYAITHHESSQSTMGLPHRWIVKSVIPITMLLIMIASVARLIQEIVLLRHLMKGNNFKEREDH